MTRKQTANNNKDENIKRIDFIIHILEGKLSTQKDSYNAQSTKLTYIVGFVAILIAGYISLVFDNKIQLFVHPIITVLHALSLLGLIAVLVTLAIAIKTRVFPDPPELETIYSQKSFDMSEYDLKNQVAADMKECYRLCNTELDKIAKWIDYTLIILAVSIILMLVASASQQYYNKVVIMGSNNSKPTPATKPQPVAPSQKPGNDIRKGPVQPSVTPGSSLPFGEPKSKTTIK